MPSWRAILGLFFLFLGAAVHADDKQEEWARWKKDYVEKILPIIQTKCIDCHGADSPDGEFDLSKFPDGESAEKGGDIWERVARRVRLNEMPPPGSPGLNDPQKGAFHRWVDTRPSQDLCNQIASDETQSWYRGHVMSRRLTRTEYSNAIRDITGVTPNEELLPPEDGGGGEGFDTVGDSLFTSPIHLEAYLRVTDQAIEEMFSKPNYAPQEGWTLEALRNFARFAWRRPIQEEEFEKVASLYQHVQASGGDERAALKQAYKGVLLSPNFLFVNEPEPDAPGVQRLTPHQFAMRISLVLWSSIPDAELLRLADDGTIFEPEVVRNQIKRMLADDRARALGENFGLQWLGLRDFQRIKPDGEVFPEYDAELANSAIEETIRFVSGVFREDRPLTDLLDSDYLILNRTLAQFYGIPWTADGEWATIPLPEQERSRGGVATMASVLIKTSYPRRTSPVLRGRWVLEDLLGSKVPPPPPDVPALEEAGHEEAKLTFRERLEIHRKNPACASCHDRMDPLGFGLENFDAIGRWRTEEDGKPIDSVGTLPSGDRFEGSQELKQILLKRKDEFYHHLTRKLVGFALGRSINKFDQCIIDKSIERLHKENRSTVILEEILLSYGFQHRYFSSAKDKQ